MAKVVVSPRVRGGSIVRDFTASRKVGNGFRSGGREERLFAQVAGRSLQFCSLASRL